MFEGSAESNADAREAWCSEQLRAPAIVWNSETFDEFMFLVVPLLGFLRENGGACIAGRGGMATKSLQDVAKTLNRGVGRGSREPAGQVASGACG